MILANSQLSGPILNSPALSYEPPRHLARSRTAAIAGKRTEKVRLNQLPRRIHAAVVHENDLERILGKTLSLTQVVEHAYQRVCQLGNVAGFVQDRNNDRNGDHPVRFRMRSSAPHSSTTSDLRHITGT